VRAVVAVTGRCNLRCVTCHPQTLDLGREMTPAEIGALCRGMPALTWLDLTGGEPLLRDDIVEVLEQVLTHSPGLAVLHFPTNGWFRRRAVECVRRVRARRPELSLLVTVSVDGPPQLHDRMRGREGAYRKALETYRSLRALPGVEAVVGTTVGPDNRQALDETRSALQRDLPGFDDRDWHWNLCQISSHFFANQELASRLDPGQDASLVRRQIRRRWPPQTAMETMEFVFLVNLLAHVGGESHGLPCPALRTTCFVSADARLYPCHLFDRPVVDLRSRDMDPGAVWNTPDVLHARREVERLTCGGCFTPCEAYPMVVGSPARAAWMTGLRLGRMGLARLRRHRADLVSSS